MCAEGDTRVGCDVVDGSDGNDFGMGGNGTPSSSHRYASSSVGVRGANWGTVVVCASGGVCVCTAELASGDGECTAEWVNDGGACTAECNSGGGECAAECGGDSDVGGDVDTASGDGGGVEAAVGTCASLVGVGGKPTRSL